MTRIHHATAARATKLGLEILPSGDGFRFSNSETGQISAEIWETAKGALDAFAAGDYTWELQTRGKSGCMDQYFHDLYTANGGGCGDTLDATLRDHLLGAEGIDLQLLRVVADANNLWNSRWESLNPGMQRMNLSNRLRAILRNSSTAQVTIGDDHGRFGVPFRPSTRVAKALAKTEG